MSDSRIVRRRFRRLLAYGVTGAVALVGLAGCGGGDTTSDTTSTTAGKPQFGGTLSFYTPAKFESWDMFNGSTVAVLSNSNVSPQLFDRLTWQDPATGKMLPWIATGWTVSEDRLSYAFEIRKGVTFSDGTALDAAAIKANFDVRGLGDSALGITPDPFWQNYDKTVVQSPTSFTVHLSAPDNGWLQATSTYRSGSLLGLKTLKLGAAERGVIQNNIGSGPFVFASGNGTNAVVLKRRDDYDWAPPSARHQGKAYLESIEYKTVAEPNVLLGALAGGQAQIVQGISPHDETTVTSQGGVLFARSVQGTANALQFSLLPEYKSPVLDLQVRQALIAATNRPDIIKAVLTPNYKVAAGPLVSGTPDFADGSEYLTYDLEKAAQLLDAAGWQLGSDGMRTKDGKSLTLAGYVSPTDPNSPAIYQLLQQQWKEVGIDLQLQTLPFTQYVNDLYLTGKFPFLTGQTSRADPNVLYSVWDSKAANGLYTTKPEFDRLLRDVATTEPANRKDAVAKASDYMLSNALAIPMYEPAQVYGLSKKVDGFAVEPTVRSVLYDTWLGS